MHGVVVFAVALIIWPTMVLADWEFTRWGMTVDEVQKASRFSAIQNGLGSGCVLEMPGPITIQGTRFDWIKFCFDDNNLLVSVDLLASVRAYDAIESSLQRAYGSPQLQTGVDKPEPTWTDRERGNTIHLSRAEKTILTYRQTPQSAR